MIGRHRDAEALFAREQTLRDEADAMLRESGLGAVLTGHGFVAAGSYAMRTMTRRDLDFERAAEPDWSDFWRVCTELGATGWCTRFVCVDHYREQHETAFGIQGGVRLAPPLLTKPASRDNPQVWQLDLWQMRAAEFEEQLGRQRAIWQQRLNDDMRCTILAIKEEACRFPEYGRTMIAPHVYEAVLEQGIREWDSFFGWWRRKYRGML